MEHIKKSEPRNFAQEAVTEGYHAYIKEVLSRAIEPLVWTLSTDGSPRIDKIMQEGTALAERLRPNWRPPAAEEVATLKSLPEWSVDLFQNSYVGRQAAALGAMEGDEVSFVALLLQAIFAVEALKQVGQKQPALAKKYASRFAVWPWFVSSVDNFDKQLRAELDTTLGFASKTRSRHKMGSVINNSVAPEVMAMLLWFRLEAECWDEKQPNDPGVLGDSYREALRAMQAMPDCGGKSIESITSIISPVLTQLVKDIYNTKMRMPYDEYLKDVPNSVKERDLKRTLDQVIEFMLRPDPAAGSGGATQDTKPKPAVKKKK
jgi:hypothetical protein